MVAVLVLDQKMAQFTLLILPARAQNTGCMTVRMEQQNLVVTMRTGMYTAA